MLASELLAMQNKPDLTNAPLGNKMNEQKSLRYWKNTAKKIFLLCTAGLLSFGTNLRAENPTADRLSEGAARGDKTKHTVPKEENETKDSPPELAAPKKATKTSEDIFKPSVEISEDFASPFPVDI